MMKDEKSTINPGGINGLGTSLIDKGSDDFKSLQEAIRKEFESQTQQDVIENNLLSIRFQIESYLNEPVEYDDIKIPGFFIEKILKSIKVSKKQLAEYIDYEYTNLISLLKGRRKINSDLAIKFGQIFKVDPAVWLHIESKNELAKEMSTTKNSFSLSELLKKAS